MNNEPMVRVVVSPTGRIIGKVYHLNQYCYVLDDPNQGVNRSGNKIMTIPRSQADARGMHLDKAHGGCGG